MWILAILTAAVALIVVITARAELARVTVQAHSELAHETDKFRDFAAKPNPTTGKPYTSLESLITHHLQMNLPEHGEAFFSIVDGKADKRSVGNPPVRLDKDADFVAMAAKASSPQLGELTSDGGEVAYAIVPVHVKDKTETAQLVIVEYLAPQYEEAWATIWTMTSIAVVALLIAGLFGWLVAGRVLAPIRQLSTTASRISEADLSERIQVSGTDDVSHLGNTFNNMLDRLEAAFDGQRQFLDDAGHELRTPITVVRGHLDVMGDDPTEQKHTLDLVRDELGRMSRLVDDLVILARSERPDFVVRANTDLADLVVESFTKATALAKRQWQLDATPNAYGMVDEQRLTQALLQLASNSINYTDAADTIAFGGDVTDSALRLWVRDTGRGIDPEEHERIFARFVRGSGARSDIHGSGLGLTIVSQIAKAHGGGVSVKSALGEGSTFTIELPWTTSETTTPTAPTITKEVT
jgi:two-component system OmpR family sensor kinase